MNILRRRTFMLWPLAVSLVTWAGQASAATQPSNAPSPLVEKVRTATEQYKDINAALNQGFAQATPCVSGPDFGAMGVHFVLNSRVMNGVLSPDQPQALIYEPMAGGAFRFVGVEFIVLAQVWTSQHPNGGPPPALEGHLMNFVPAPNRYGLPDFYELHVWAWEQNPVGSFADWNTRVTCDNQPVN